MSSVVQLMKKRDLLMQKHTLEPVETAGTPASKPLTAAQNLILTVKILLGGGTLVGAIWALDQFVR